jgi:hypothetical protein
MVGITGVGVWVLIAAAFLTIGGPDRLPTADAAAGTQALLLVGVLVAYVAVSLPFDLMGGLVLPRRHGRPTPTTGRYLVAWARGVSVQAVVMAGSATAIVLVGRAWGDAAAVLTVAVIATAIAVGRLPLARLVASLGAPRTWRESPRVAAVAASDIGFTGGITGAGRRIVVPAAWTRALGEGLAIEVVRRRAIAGAGYWLGIAVALAWTVAGVALAMALPGGGAAGMGEVVTTGAWFTLWSFVGLLVLPMVSRPAVHQADAAAAEMFPPTAVAALIRALDALQDDEPERSGVVEAIFHPIPGAAGRIARLGAAARGPRPWNVARMALPMSWCCMGLLGRAVHCNAGRPELWVMLPTD